MKIEPFPFVPVHKKSPGTNAPANLAKITPASTQLIDLKNSSAASEIMQKYDLNKMSQRELEKMARDLVKSGVMSEKQGVALMSTALFAPVKASKEEYEAWANKKFNVLDGMGSRLNFQRQHMAGDQKSILYLERVHDILMSLAALNSRTAN